MSDRKENIENGILQGIVAGLIAGVIMTVVAHTIASVPLQSTQISQEETEMKKVCVEKDIDFVEAYPEGEWERLEEIPEEGVIKKEDFTNVGGNIWLTLNTSVVEPPEKIKYKSVSECTAYKEVVK